MIILETIINNEQDYRHLNDKDRYREMYEEVGTVEANKTVHWREEWMRHFHPKEGARILELGAHNGPNLIHYGRTGNYVDGVEISSTLIETFEKHKKLEPLDVQERVNMHQGWIEEFTTNNPYDYVLVTEVLEHVPDPVVILQKACDCVKRSGIIYISSPTNHWGNNTHVRGVPPNELKIWLEKAGMEAEELFTEDHGWTFCLARKKSFIKTIKAFLKLS